MKIVSLFGSLTIAGMMTFFPSFGQVLKDKKPNILFIIADDYGWKDMSCSGSTYYETPNLDRLAQEGVRFTHAYSACSVCSPSRATVLTGQYTPRHDITNFTGPASGVEWRKMNRFTKMLPPEYAHELSSSSVTLAEVLRQQGYKTFFAGKWHLGSEGSYPEDHGFDINKGGSQAGAPSGGYFSPYNNPTLSDGPNGEDLSMRLAEETSAFIKNQVSRNANQPFFAYLSFYAVHSPIQTTQAKWKYFRDKAEKQGIAQTGFIIDRTLPVHQTQDNPIYAGLVQQMDDAIGLVLQQLKDLGIDKNTMVVFTSDNGGVSSGDDFSTSNLPLRGGKGRQWEAGTRVPLIIKTGQEVKNKICDVPVMGIDFFPTILEYAGLPQALQKQKDGVSLMPLLRGNSIKKRMLYWHYPHYGNQGGEPSSTVLAGDWKLIYYHEDGRNELYNLKMDESESQPFNDKYPNQVKDLQTKLDKWLVEVKAKMPTPDPLYDSVKAAALLKKQHTELLINVEKKRLRMLEKDFRPNATWWKSKQTIDQ